MHNTGDEGSSTVAPSFLHFNITQCAFGSTAVLWAVLCAVLCVVVCAVLRAVLCAMLCVVWYSVMCNIGFVPDHRIGHLQRRRGSGNT